MSVIRFALRLTVNGGREALVRLILIAAAVALGSSLLLVTLAGINAVNVQNDRYAWLGTGSTSGPAGASSHDPLWWLLSADRFSGQLIGRVDVAATGPSSPVPPGIPHLPGPAQYYVSPALAALLRDTPASELADRFPGREIGVIGAAALPAPGSLIIVVGHTAAQLSGVPGAIKVTTVNSTPLSSCNGTDCRVGVGIDGSGIDLIFSVVALALLLRC
jgi:hypothetical protein